MVIFHLYGTIYFICSTNNFLRYIWFYCLCNTSYTFINVINNEANLNQALIKDKRIPDLYILPASQTRDKDALTLEGVDKILKALAEEFDYIICDSPAGIETGALTAMYFADHAIIVTNPEISSVRDSDRILGILASKSKRAIEKQTPIQEHLLLTRYDPYRVEKGEMLSVADVKDILAIPLIGVIPESQAVLKASNTGTPVTLDEESDAGIAYHDAIERFLGNERPMRFTHIERKGLLRRLFSKNKEDALV